MTESTWGLLGPEFLPNLRRTRTLGLGATVRFFNDLAVPGLGGVWYGKQLLLATLGVSVAERTRKAGRKVRNIEVTNAIEALSCWLALKKNGWPRDARLRGHEKLRNREESDFNDFNQVKAPRFYVTQPMRMSTAQALPALGLVETDSVRFNAFRRSEDGEEFIKMACGQYRPHKLAVDEYLSQWVSSEQKKLSSSDSLYEALSPLTPLPKDAQQYLRGLIQKDTRRNDALAWVEQINNQNTFNRWETKPDCIQEQHWTDMKAGAWFFGTRDAAMAVLDALEAYLDNTNLSYSLNAHIPDKLENLLKELETAAQAYLNLESRPDDDHEAEQFCGECIQEKKSDVLRCLVSRDGRVLRLMENVVKPGPAFRGNTRDENTDDDETVFSDTEKTTLPDGISYRVFNLRRLALDLDGKLGQWLNPQTEGENNAQ